MVQLIEQIKWLVLQMGVVSPSKISNSENALQIWEETATIHVTSNEGSYVLTIHALSRTLSPWDG